MGKILNTTARTTASFIKQGRGSGMINFCPFEPTIAWPYNAELAHAGLFISIFYAFLGMVLLMQFATGLFLQPIGWVTSTQAIRTFLESI
jgi:hypothetical protein